MKKEMMLKIITVILIGMMLCTMTTKVFADDSNDFWEDVEVEGGNPSGTIDPEDELDPEPPKGNDPANNGNSYNTDLPHAGAAENTAMVVAVTVLGIVAVYAYKKMNYYTNI